MFFIRRKKKKKAKYDISNCQKALPQIFGQAVTECSNRYPKLLPPNISWKNYNLNSFMTLCVTQKVNAQRKIKKMRGRGEIEHTKVFFIHFFSFVVTITSKMKSFICKLQQALIYHNYQQKMQFDTLQIYPNAFLITKGFIASFRERLQLGAVRSCTAHIVCW